MPQSETGLSFIQSLPAEVNPDTPKDDDTCPKISPLPGKSSLLRTERPILSRPTERDSYAREFPLSSPRSSPRQPIVFTKHFSRRTWRSPSFGPSFSSNEGRG